MTKKTKQYYKKFSATHTKMRSEIRLLPPFQQKSKIGNHILTPPLAITKMMSLLKLISLKKSCRFPKRKFLATPMFAICIARKMNFFPQR